MLVALELVWEGVELQATEALDICPQSSVGCSGGSLGDQNAEKTEVHA